MSLVPVQFVNPFSQAVRKICGDTLRLPITAGPIRLQKPGEQLWEAFPVAAVINLQGGVRGLVALDFSQPVALGIAGALAQERFTEFDENARDALGEVANLVVGSAKRDLPGGLVTISTPQILPTQIVGLPPRVPSLILPFRCPIGAFVLNIAFARAGPVQVPAAGSSADAPMPADWAM